MIFRIFKQSLLFIFLLFSSCDSSSKPTLYLFGWSGFFSPDLIEAFEEKYQCDVVIDTYDSNESMYAKLKLSSTYYDIIIPSNYYMELLQQQNMIQALDPEKIPNIKNLDPKYFKGTLPLYGLPFMVSFSGIAYRKDKVSVIDPSWDIFSRSDLKGRMTMLNDSREALGAALRYLGDNINSRSIEKVNQAGDLLIDWKKNLAKFESEQYKDGLATGEFLVAQAYSMDIARVIEDNPHIAFAYPKEGAIMSIDYLAIPSHASNVDLAHAFLNYMYEIPVAIENMTFTNSLIPVLPAYPLLDRKKREDPLLFPPEEVLQKMQLIEDLQQDMQIYYKVWDKVKSG